MTAGLFTRSLVGAAAVAMISQQAAAQGSPPSSFVGRGFADGCNAVFCSWDDFAPTVFAFGLTLNPQISLNLAPIACHGCRRNDHPAANPLGITFTLPNGHGNPKAGGTSTTAFDSHGPDGSPGNSGNTAAAIGTPAGPGNIPQNGSPSALQSVDLLVTTAPEPTTWALMAAGLVGLVPLIRRKRRD